jgi:hypothetical protein
MKSIQVRIWVSSVFWVGGRTEKFVARMKVQWIVILSLSWRRAVEKMSVIERPKSRKLSRKYLECLGCSKTTSCNNWRKRVVHGRSIKSAPILTKSFVESFVSQFLTIHLVRFLTLNCKSKLKSFLNIMEICGLRAKFNVKHQKTVWFGYSLSSIKRWKMKKFLVVMRTFCQVLQFSLNF